MTVQHHLPLGAVLEIGPDYQVYVLTARRPHAVCLCGWSGPKRISTGSARVDAWIHAAREGHPPASPLGISRLSTMKRRLPMSKRVRITLLAVRVRIAEVRVAGSRVSY